MNMGKPKIRFKGFDNDWEQRKFGELLKEVRDKTTVEDEDTLLSCAIDGMFLNSELFSHFRGSSNIGYLKVKKNDLILSAQNLHLGNCNVNLRFEHGIISPAYKVYELIECDPLFIQAWVKQDKTKDFFLKASTEGASVCRKNIVWGELYKQELPIPDMEEQKLIGNYFNKLDNLITLHQRKCEETKKLKKYMLQKMFPQNGSKVPEIRFKGFTDDWEQRKLGEIIIEYKETVDSDCTLPILTSSKTEGVILQEEHFGRKQQHDITGYNILPRNYCTYRNRSDGVDFTFNINKCCDKGIISKFYPVFSGNNSDVFFLSLVLNNSEEVVHEIAYTCTGTGQKVLSFLDLKKMKVRVPSFDEQKKIAAYFDDLDHLITLHQNKCEELKKIKKYMLQNMFV